MLIGRVSHVFMPKSSHDQLSRGKMSLDRMIYRGIVGAWVWAARARWAATAA
jgi:hypothetical protein